MCGFASTSSCSLHASAGLQPRCHAAHTRVRVCICIVLQAARECRFANQLSCSPHASAGLHPRCPVARTLQPHHFAAHTQVQVCNLVVMQPTHKCGFATTFCPLTLQSTSKLVATTLLTLPIALGLAILKRSRASLLFAPTAAAQAHSTCHAASLTPVRPRAVTAMLRELAAPPRRSLPHST